MLFDASFLQPVSLLFLRMIIAIIFFSSGKNHLEDPVSRGESIGMSPATTRILGAAEMIAAISLVLGIYAQLGALVIIAIMAGAIYKKIFIWKTGFYADDGYGWHYDLLLLLGSLVIFATAGGAYVII